MSIESELRALFAENGPPLTGVDLERVLRRSSRRRLSQQITLGGATTLAVAGIGIAGVTGLRGLVSSTAPGTASSANAPESGAKGVGGDSSDGRSPTPVPGEKIGAENLNRCGGPLARVAPNEAGLVVTASFAPADAASGRVSGIVTLTNTGPDRVFGSSPAFPAMTLSQHGVVLWHSNGPAPAMAALVDLAPGASLTYRAWFEPVRCAVEDDRGGGFRTDLPPVSPGVYEVSAALDLTRQTLDGALPSTELVTGPTAEVTLR